MIPMKGFFVFLSILSVCFCLDYNKNIYLRNGHISVKDNVITHSLSSEDLSHINVAESKDIAQFLFHFKMEEHESKEHLIMKKEAVERFLNINLSDYIPHNVYRGYINIKSPLLLESQEKYSDFLSIVPVKPEYKLSSSILDSQYNSFGSNVEYVALEISVINAKNINMESFGRFISYENGFNIRGKPISNGVDKIYISIKDYQQVYQIASLLSRFDDVLFISLLVNNEVMNYNAGSIVISGEDARNDTSFYIGFKSNFTGSGESVAVCDTGLDYNRCYFYDDKNPEPKFYNVDEPAPKNATHRKVSGYLTLMDDLSRHTHGTHVAGTVAGKSNCNFGNKVDLSKFDGVSPSAKILFTDIGCDKERCDCPDGVPCDCVFRDKQYCTYDQLGIPLDYEKYLFPWSKESGAFIHTNSWGSDLNAYDTITKQIDSFAHSNPEFLILFAAGNSYPKNVGRQAQAKNIITVGSSDTIWETFEYDYFTVKDYDVSAKEVQKSLKEQDLNCDVTPDLCQFRDEENVNSATCCKYVENHASCGVEMKASQLLKCCKKCAQNYALSLKDTTSPRNVSFFTSVGPTIDGRIKPDFVVPGNELLSARSHFPKVPPNVNDSSLHFHVEGMRGTSMATPLAAGFAASIRQYLKTQHKIESPSSSLIKAVLINSASPLKPNVTYPNNNAGFGRVQFNDSIPIDKVTKRLSLFAFDDVTVGNESVYYINVDSDTRPLQITLVWNDPVASSLADVQLVNDLDLFLKARKGKEFNSNGLVNKTDDINNVEKIRVNQPEVGIYTITVKPKSTADKNQKFSLVISGDVVLIDEKEIIKTKRLKLIVLIVAVIVTVATLAAFLLVALIKRKRALSEGYTPIQD